jgi:hypothetical protein
MALVTAMHQSSNTVLTKPGKGRHTHRFFLVSDHRPMSIKTDSGFAGSTSGLNPHIASSRDAEFPETTTVSLNNDVSLAVVLGAFSLAFALETIYLVCVLGNIHSSQEETDISWIKYLTVQPLRHWDFQSRGPSHQRASAVTLGSFVQFVEARLRGSRETAAVSKM